MAVTPHKAAQSILVTRPSNPYIGLLSGIKRRQGFAASAALLCITADFLPLILCNIPLRSGSPVMAATHNVCCALSLAMLAFMMLVLLVSLVVKLPYMPGDPRTIAGAAAYIADSVLVPEIKQCQSSMMSSRDREMAVAQLGRRYALGDINGVSHAQRYGVEVSSAAYDGGDGSSAV